MFPTRVAVARTAVRAILAVILIGGASSQLLGQYATQGIISTVAGDGIANCHLVTSGCEGSYSGDNGLAINAGLNNPQGVAVDSAGNVYIADQGNLRIRRVDRTTGIITTVAGGGSYDADNIPAVSAGLSGPWDVALDGSGTST